MFFQSLRTTGVSLFLCGRSSDGRNSFVLTSERFCSFSLLHVTMSLNNFLGVSGCSSDSECEEEQLRSLCSPMKLGELKWRSNRWFMSTSFSRLAHELVLSVCCLILFATLKALIQTNHFFSQMLDVLSILLVKINRCACVHSESISHL